MSPQISQLLMWKQRLVAKRVTRELMAAVATELDVCVANQQTLKYFHERFDLLLRDHGALTRFRSKVATAPTKPNERSRMWTAMRIATRFSAQEIAAAAEAEVRPVRIFINALVQAGYIRVLRPTSFEKGDFTSYQLLKNTGPDAPRLRADGASVLDLNQPEGQQEVPRVRA